VLCRVSTVRLTHARSPFLQGLTSLDFAEAHLQVRLSSLAGASVNEEVYLSNVVNLEEQAASHLTFRRKFSFVVTPEVAAHLQRGYAKVELFARCQPTFLERLARWDDLRELLESSPPTGPTSTQRPEPMRRSESSFVQEEEHDVAARLQILELDAAGKWTSVPVQSQGPSGTGSYFLQQGVQRRFRFSLLHGSGKALRWIALSRVSVGQTRLVSKGVPPVAEDAAELDLRILPTPETEPVDFHPNGTSTLTAEALWDSSAHESAALNRPSASGQRVVLRLTFLVQIANAERPATFALDISVKILARGGGGPGSFLGGLWGQARLLKQTTTLFSLNLSPAPTRSAADLWRLDTSQCYVRGEETLPSGWHVRGVSAVKDFLKLQRAERLAADVRAVQVLSTACDRPVSSPRLGSQGRDPDGLKRRVVELWSRPSGSAVESALTRTTVPTSTLLASLVDLSPKLVPAVTLARRSDVVAKKKGWLDVLVDAPNNVWVKRFCVLRRPYLHLYASNAETDEVSIINLTSDRSTGGGDLTIVSSPEVEHLLGVSPFRSSFQKLSTDPLLSSSALPRLYCLFQVELARLRHEQRQRRARLAPDARTQHLLLDDLRTFSLHDHDRLSPSNSYTDRPPPPPPSLSIPCPLRVPLSLRCAFLELAAWRPALDATPPSLRGRASCCLLPGDYRQRKAGRAPGRPLLTPTAFVPRGPAGRPFSPRLPSLRPHPSLSPSPTLFHRPPLSTQSSNMTSVPAAFAMLPKDYAWTALVASSTCASPSRPRSAASSPFPEPCNGLLPVDFLTLAMLLCTPSFSLPAPLSGAGGLQGS